VPRSHVVEVPAQPGSRVMVEIVDKATILELTRAPRDHITPTMVEIRLKATTFMQTWTGDCRV